MVGEAWSDAAHLGRESLDRVRRRHAPYTHSEEAHGECADDERRVAATVQKERQRCGAEDQRGSERAAAAEPALGEPSPGGRPRNGADIERREKWQEAHVS